MPEPARTVTLNSFFSLQIESSAPAEVSIRAAVAVKVISWSLSRRFTRPSPSITSKSLLSHVTRISTPSAAIVLGSVRSEVTLAALSPSA